MAIYEVRRGIPAGFFHAYKRGNSNERVMFLTAKTKYAKKTDIPQYNPTGETPELHELIDERKTNDLIAEIECSTLGIEEQRFLKKAARRHTAFNYRKIAEYYVNATKEMQELMEKSALVIIDYENAIKNGYARLSKRVKEMSKSNA